MNGKIPAIICAGENGRAVVFGWVDALPEPDEKVTIHNARMVLRWDEKCGGLFGLAANGPAADTRITHLVEQTTCVARQALTVTPEAAKGITRWKPWG